MNTRLAASFAAIAFAVAGAWAADTQTNLDNTILAAVLTRAYPDGGYAVVHPKAGLDAVDVALAREIKDRMESATSASTRAVVASLVHRLFERNKMSGTLKAIQLSLASCAKDGYVVDYEGKYHKYFQNDGGSWPRFYQENPGVQGIVTVSLPAYDEKTGLVLVYRGTHIHGLAGWGEVMLYRYERGKLRQLKTMRLWRA